MCRAHNFPTYCVYLARAVTGHRGTAVAQRGCGAAAPCGGDGEDDAGPPGGVGGWPGPAGRAGSGAVSPERRILDTSPGISLKVDVHDEVSPPGTADCLPEPAFGAFGGEAEGGVAGVGRGTAVGGACSGGVGRLLAGVRSSRGGLAPAGRSLAASLLSAGAAPVRGGAGGVSTLPRMIGRPSLPLPMTTIFEFDDCESWTVASIPRQRR